MRERILEIADEIFEGWGYIPERDELKQRLVKGEHHWRGFHYEVVKNWIPEDAVLSIGEADPYKKTTVYRVLSDAFTENDPDWLTPELTLILTPEQAGIAR